MSSQPALPLSLFNLLRQQFGNDLQPLRCTKATLVHVSHTLEDLVLTRQIPAVLFTGFQESSHWREETERYRALAEIAQQVCIFAGGQLPPESSARELHITLGGDDPLRQEWFLALLSPQFAVLLCGQDRQTNPTEEAIRQFDTLWSFRPDVINQVLDLLETVVADYRPDRLEQIRAARRAYPPSAPDPDLVTALTSEMIRFEEELHQRLSAATARLNQQLKWRENLLATLVHDMRTPLQALAGGLQLIEMAGDKLDAAKQARLLEGARRGANNLNEMIQLILDSNRLDEGELVLEWQAIEPQPWLDDIVQALHPLAEAMGLTLESQVHPAVPLMWGDGSLLRRVIQNLVGNAVKFTPKGGKISIIIAPSPRPDHIEIRVRDTGTGMRPEILPQIFDRYYQGNKEDHKGYGLGLYFCRLAVEAHGGVIQAASQVGSGTTISVILPNEPKLNF